MEEGISNTAGDSPISPKITIGLFKQPKTLMTRLPLTFPPQPTQDLRTEDTDPTPLVKNSPLLMAKKKIQKALLVARFTKDTKKSAKNTDLRKQINTARDIKCQQLTGMSRELNVLARQMDELGVYNSQSALHSHRSSLIMGERPVVVHTVRKGLSRRNKSLSEVIEQKQKKVHANMVQSTLTRKLRIVNKYDRSECNRSRTLSEKKKRYKEHGQEEERKIREAKEKLKRSMEEVRREHEEKEEEQRQRMDQKQDFKETIIKSRSEYLKKKNEMAMSQAKERYEMNQFLDMQNRRSNSHSTLKSLKAKDLRDQHIKEVKLKAELKNREQHMRSQSCLEKKEMDTVELKNRIIEEEVKKDERRFVGIRQSISQDPSYIVWMQKGASGSRLKQAITQDGEEGKRNMRVREELRGDFEQVSVRKFEETYEMKAVEGEEQMKKKVKRVRIKEPQKVEEGEKIKKLERIVDTDKYDFTNMGYEWDIINGYMGGEKKNKKISYERALAMTQDSRVLPFEIRKKERLFNVTQCFKLEKDLTTNNFENALQFLKLRNDNYSKEKALQLARKVSCREHELRMTVRKKSGLTELMQNQMKENDADIDSKTQGMQMEVMKDLLAEYQRREAVTEQEEPKTINHKKSQSMGASTFGDKLKQELQQAQQSQDDMNNVVRVLARRSQNRAYRKYYEKIQQEQREREAKLKIMEEEKPIVVEKVESPRSPKSPRTQKPTSQRNLSQFNINPVKELNGSRTRTAQEAAQRLQSPLKLLKLSERNNYQSETSKPNTAHNSPIRNMAHLKLYPTNFSQRTLPLNTKMSAATTRVGFTQPSTRLEQVQYSSKLMKKPFEIPKQVLTNQQVQNLQKMREKQEASQRRREEVMMSRKVKAQTQEKYEEIKQIQDQQALEKILSQESRQKQVMRHLHQLESLKKVSHQEKSREREGKRKHIYQQMMVKAEEERQYKEDKLKKKLQKIEELGQVKEEMYREAQKMAWFYGQAQQNISSDDKIMLHDKNTQSEEDEGPQDNDSDLRYYSEGNDHYDNVKSGCKTTRQMLDKKKKSDRTPYSRNQIESGATSVRFRGGANNSSSNQGLQQLLL